MYTRVVFIVHLYDCTNSVHCVCVKLFLNQYVLMNLFDVVLILVLNSFIHFQTLLHLEMEHNSFCPSDWSILAEALKRNHTLLGTYNKRLLYSLNSFYTGSTFYRVQYCVHP